MKKYFFITFLSILFAFFLGFTSGVKQIFPYQIIKKMLFVFQDLSFSSTTLGECKIPKIKMPLNNFSVIIGHAYGAPRNTFTNDYIAKNVLTFLENNKDYIQSLIFTGDVFNVPSTNKWQRLLENFDSANVLIAPGNHDIQRSDSLEVFKSNKSIQQNYPFAIKTNDVDIIIDDSVSSNWLVSDQLRSLLENIEDKNIVIARHNILISDLLKYANSSGGYFSLPEINKFINYFSANQSFTWIMGDGGAHEHLPRIVCYNYKNHRFIINGIGEQNGDTVIILKNGEIFQYQLSNP